MPILKISALLGLLAVASASSLHAAGYPDHPVKVIVPFPAGGVTDIATRVIVQRLSERLGQQFYVENIGGAGGNIGMAGAAHAAGDGYTILRLIEHRGEPEPVQENSFRREEGSRPGYQGGSIPELLAGQSRFSGQNDEGVDRLDEGQPRQAQCRFPGDRHDAIALDRTPQAGTWGQLRHRSLCWRRAHDSIAARRFYPHCVRGYW